MKYYMIKRNNHSGGGSLIAWNHKAEPFYSAHREDALKFVELRDAEVYNNYCARTMPTEEGQTDWAIVIEDEKD